MQVVCNKQQWLSLPEFANFTTVEQQLDTNWNNSELQFRVESLKALQPSRTLVGGLRTGGRINSETQKEVLDA
jgi:hypothetical protein